MKLYRWYKKLRRIAEGSIPPWDVYLVHILCEPIEWIRWKLINTGFVHHDFFRDEIHIGHLVLTREFLNQFLDDYVVFKQWYDKRNEQRE